MTKVLVTGANGQLGQCLQKISVNYSHIDFIFSSSVEVNIEHLGSLDKIFNREKPDFVVNCAAYTAVDLAEDLETSAKQTNCAGPSNLASVCKKHGCTLIHVSTDFVFKGEEVKLLNENDDTYPINVYGKTKLDGEKAIQSILNQYIIIRTSWLYSEFGNNFVKTMLRLGPEKEELNVVADQVGTPTYAVDLAHAILTIIESADIKYGVYHYSNEGVTSWYDFAIMIFKLSGNRIKVNPISSAAYPTKAKRPKFSVMDKSKIKQTFDLIIPHWIESLEGCVENLKPKT